MTGLEGDNNAVIMERYSILSRAPVDFLKECERTSFQGSGPGGQKRNRVYSGVRLRHLPTRVTVTSCAYRESQRNLQDAVRKLRIDLALSVPADRQSPPLSSYKTLSFERGKPWPIFRAQANAEHPDFPHFVLQAVHAMRTHAGVLSDAAEELGATPSSLARFCKLDKGLWRQIQDMRRDQGLRTLK